MKRSACHHLLELASISIESPLESDIESGPLVGQLISGFLSHRNGFYAFESALLVRPLTSRKEPCGLIEWNDPERWKAAYSANLSGEIFFAENTFGEQFSLREDGIFRFDPEIGSSEFHAADLEEWSKKILTDANTELGHQIASDWQRRNHPLAPGYRLCPKTPFVTGGEYTLENLTLCADEESMTFRAQIANQIIDIPDGSRAMFRLIE